MEEKAFESHQVAPNKGVVNDILVISHENFIVLQNLDKEVSTINEEALYLAIIDWLRPLIN